ncbi:uncharacterized protein LOC133928174 [Phragmites australis]|uniref:uncharacterized protein LOC133928174 n=1 Tax=Phragmites australis TaxID=29695 RepID=UPI002D7A1CD6|nr:uncharacterized protein LOC133928174 [Phragmites australis]
MGCVLVDGGSSINLLFADPLDTLQVLRNLLKLSPPFFEITPDSSAKSLGYIEMPVTFGLLSNFRTERVLFDVVDFGTVYNAILGRPAMAQFMVVAHYAYQAIKIPGPKGAIAILGNKKTALHYDKKSLDMVELTLGSQPEEERPSCCLEKVHVIANPDDRLKAVSLNSADPS